MIQRKITNHYLNESKLMKAKTEYELELKIKKQKQQWQEKEQLLRMKIDAKNETDHVLGLIQNYRNLLLGSLDINHAIGWDMLYDKKEFNLTEPILEDFINEVGVPKEEVFIELIFSSVKKKREEKLKEAERLFQEASIEFLYEKNRFYNEQKEKDTQVDNFRKGFEKGNKEPIEKYFTMVLNNSSYPKGFIKEFSLGFDQQNKNLIIEYSVPHPDNIPNIIEYRFIQARQEIEKKFMKKADFQEFYNDVIYQITLRTIYECFISDYPHHLDTIVFNGWVHGIDTSTGIDFSSRIISILVNYEEFMSLNLQRVVAKDCFRKLKGQSAGPLYHLSPVKPILELMKDDERFIETRDVLAEINSIPNLAEMEWDDFEHLVTNLFSLYFKEIGEVKITRKSREGGIDGVIFDPDPIRGGKYLIQAKRYNDIVPPAAVRELNGAKDHEKATRGILITTGYFGPDSLTFATENNITLIDGNRLVYMLNEHGYQVRCEIKNGRKKSS